MSRLKAKPPDETATGHCKGLVFGKPKTGKTWFALSFPKPYYFDTEGGAALGRYQKRLKEAGGGYMGPKDGTLDFETLIQQIDALSTEKHDYQTLVIDSITKIYQTSIQSESERLGKKDVFGAAKKPVVGMMRRLISRIDRLDMNVWFVAQEIAEYGKDDTGQREETGRVPDVWDKLMYELDLTLRIEYLNPKLRTATVTATRLEGLKMGDRFEVMKDGVDVGYQNFAPRYGKDFIEGPVKQIVLATAEQVAEVKKLLDVVKIEEKEIEKWFTKAGVDDWSEMTTETIGATIEFIRKKVQ